MKWIKATDRNPTDTKDKCLNFGGSKHIGYFDNVGMWRYDTNTIVPDIDLEDLEWLDETPPPVEAYVPKECWVWVNCAEDMPTDEEDIYVLRCKNKESKYNMDIVALLKGYFVLSDEQAVPIIPKDKLYLYEWLSPSPLPTVTGEDGWIAVDKLPVINSDILVTNQEDKWVVCGYYTGNEWYNTFDPPGCEIYPTHWQPLPSPPVNK